MHTANFAPGFWIAIVAAVLMFLCGPFRTLVLRRKIEVQELCATGQQARVVLIHGTFARGAAWTRQDHPFITHLTEAIGPCDVYRLLWSGDNYQGARLDAVRALVHWAQHNNDGKPLYLVGHSHGGAIATMAATRMDNVPFKLITLSTPFIIVQPKYAGVLPFASSERQKRDEPLLLFGVFLWVTIGLLAAISPRLAALALLSIGPLWLLLAMLGLDRWITRMLQRSTELLRSHGESVADASLMRPPPTSLLVLRATGDEASGALGAMHVVSWLLVWILKYIGQLASVLLWVEELDGRLPSRLRRLGLLALRVFLFAFLAPILIALYLSTPSAHLADLGTWAMFATLAMLPMFLILQFRVAYLIIAPALTIAATVINTLLLMPFGLDLAVRSALIAVSAEPTPLGSWPLRVSPPGEGLLAHSALYEGPIVQYAVKDFLERSAQLKPAL